MITERVQKVVLAYLKLFQDREYLFCTRDLFTPNNERGTVLNVALE